MAQKTDKIGSDVSEANLLTIRLNIFLELILAFLTLGYGGAFADDNSRANYLDLRACLETASEPDKWSGGPFSFCANTLISAVS
ncbi:hypothetical protein [Asaia sp. SF2.1]|uniref:hypothetical protein n=1 Tax=Asaia sp. SF2.1 TaxID=406101 RepID=UPI001267F9C5|nr:hypothetical protein [Asaia sp. SF2.1]